MGIDAKMFVCDLGNKVWACGHPVDDHKKPVVTVGAYKLYNDEPGACEVLGWDECEGFQEVGE